MLDFLLRPLRRSFGRDKAYYTMVDEMFGFVPHNIELYKLALIHKSAFFGFGGRAVHQQRAARVFGRRRHRGRHLRFPVHRVSRPRRGVPHQDAARIVSRQSLNALAVHVGLDRHVISNGGVAFIQKHIFGDAFEAMMGAVYLDQGYEFVNRLLINNIYRRFLNVDELTLSETDYKSRLIEWCQKHHRQVLFRTEHDKGYAPNHPVFFATVLVDGIEVGHGSGDSKKEAEQQAAFFRGRVYERRAVRIVARPGGPAYQLIRS